MLMMSEEITTASIGQRFIYDVEDDDDVIAKGVHDEDA